MQWPSYTINLETRTGSTSWLQRFVDDRPPTSDASRARTAWPICLHRCTVVDTIPNYLLIDGQPPVRLRSPSIRRYVSSTTVSGFSHPHPSTDEPLRHSRVRRASDLPSCQRTSRYLDSFGNDRCDTVHTFSSFDAFSSKVRKGSKIHIGEPDVRSKTNLRLHLHIFNQFSR